MSAPNFSDLQYKIVFLQKVLKFEKLAVQFSRD